MIGCQQEQKHNEDDKYDVNCKLCSTNPVKVKRLFELPMKDNLIQIELTVDLPVRSERKHLPSTADGRVKIIFHC